MRETQLLQRDLRPFNFSGQTQSLGVFSSLSCQADEWGALFIGDDQKSIQDLKDTGDLSYKVLIKKRFYREAKLHLIAQQYKILARTITKSNSDPQKLKAAFLICFSDTKWWIGLAGDLHIFHYHNKELRLLPTSKTSHLVAPFETSIGSLFMQPLEGAFERGDIFFVLSHQVVQNINQKKITEHIKEYLHNKMTTSQMIESLVNEAQKRRGAPLCVSIFLRS